MKKMLTFERNDGSQEVQQINRTVWKEPLNKELGVKFPLLADCCPTEQHRSEPQGRSAHSSLTVA